MIILADKTEFIENQTVYKMTFDAYFPPNIKAYPETQYYKSRSGEGLCSKNDVFSRSRSLRE